ncbi:helix-turn-helix domain-containing protein [Tenacibaculum sp.]|uniref:helix-turn-helix domain-containing protein n=1 Tax=Tenacibaculum sp. TaxID=1906242 RepID=UPI003D0BA5EB
MPKQLSILFLTIFNLTVCFSQTNKYSSIELENFKSKFYLNRKIGIDSSLYYMDKLSQSDNISYKTFAYAAIEYLKTREKQPVDINYYKNTIQSSLLNIPETKQNYSMLFDIYILLGNTNKRRNLIKPALDHYLKAENYALQSDDVERIIKIKGNIALIYQDMDELEKALLKGKETLALLEEKKQVLGNKYLTQKYKTELNLGAIYTTLYKKDTLNHKFIDSALTHYNKLLKNKDLNNEDYYTARIYYSLGTAYSLKKEYGNANMYLDKSLTLFKKVNSLSYLYKANYNSGYNHFMSNDYDKAKKHFLHALNLKKDTLLDYNYINTLNYLSKIYSQQKKIDSANYFLNSFLKAYSKMSTKERQQFKEAYKIDKETDFKKKIHKLNKQTYLYTLLISILVLTLIVAGIFIIKNKREKNKAKSKLDELLAKHSNSEYNLNTSNRIKINDEQHQQIIDGLFKIEKNHYYLKEDFNLYNAAKKIGTNTTYLSNVIKKYKKMSFNDYTNELRIDYIAKLLTNDKKIRSYTTQAIAEIAGYKNAKSFTRIFKKYTGITPYQFIEKINKEL